MNAITRKATSTFIALLACASAASAQYIITSSGKSLDAQRADAQLLEDYGIQDVELWQTQNGAFATVIKEKSYHAARTTKDYLIQKELIPADSFLARGGKFVKEFSLATPFDYYVCLATVESASSAEHWLEKEEDRLNKIREEHIDLELWKTKKGSKTLYQIVVPVVAPNLRAAKQILHELLEASVPEDSYMLTGKNMGVYVSH